MKKLALILVIGAVAFMTSCGPSAKEIEAKRIADSTRVADSMAKVQAATAENRRFNRKGTGSPEKGS
jgi:hypothetical protein